MATDNEGKNWWATLPGIITSMATLITAIGGLLVILNSNGYFSHAEAKSEERAFAKPVADGDEKGLVAPNRSMPTSNFRKQSFRGNVGKLKANFELTFDLTNNKVEGSYNYPDRKGITYRLTGTYTSSGMELTERTGNEVTASCSLQTTNDNCYAGSMNNTNGRQFEMNLCKVEP